MTFAENLNRICKERGTTISTVLREMGESTSKTTTWNNGSLPKQDMLVKLANALDCSVMDFFYDGEEAPAPVQPSVPSIDLDEDETAIINLFRKLSSKEKHIFMARIYDYEANMLGKKD